MKTLFLVMILGFSGNPVEVQTSPDPVITEYLKVKEALVRSDSQDALTSSKSLLEAVNTSSFSSPDLSKAAQKLAGAKDLDKQRAEFAVLSTILWDLVKQSEYVGNTLYYQYCPMKKAYWLSGEAEIKNPYYGASMLKCGSISDQTNQ